jgi:hypothetical protein
MSRIYFSIDIETDGLVAGRNNMLSLGAAAIDMDSGKIVSKFKVNLNLVPDLFVDDDTMEWWKNFPEQYRAARENAILPAVAMFDFVAWVEFWATEESTIFCWKPGFDAAFLKYYIDRFHPRGTQLTHNGIFARQGFGLDQKTVAAIALRQPYKKTKVGELPNSLRLDENGVVMLTHSHDALEDAVEQAYIFYNSVQRLGVEL